VFKYAFISMRRDRRAHTGKQSTNLRKGDTMSSDFTQDQDKATHAGEYQDPPSEAFRALVADAVAGGSIATPMGPALAVVHAAYALGRGEADQHWAETVRSMLPVQGERPSITGIPSLNEDTMDDGLG
jgi:hypothetical protein